ncbi:MAG: hypothetical protein RIC19_02955 [Phaeodactylibacter sp.]|uniref:hypothetical protein n=1 Tax=Phaeodactylibacter sp. TaxID=1940289 RepID=UPI0032EB7688
MQEKLSCPECRSPVAADQININLLLAKCSKCGMVFSFEDRVAAVVPSAPAMPPRPRVKDRGYIPMPPGIEAQAMLSELNIQIRWRNRVQGFLVFFTILWNIFVFPFAIFAFLIGELQILLFMSLHLSVGVWLLYTLVANLVNKTTIQATNQKLIVEHAPLPIPFRGNQEADTRDIRQLYVEEYVASTTNGRPNIRYALSARMHSGQRLELIKGLKNPEEGLYIEQQIERFLDIEDQAEAKEI